MMFTVHSCANGVPAVPFPNLFPNYAGKYPVRREIVSQPTPLRGGFHVTGRNAS